MSAATAARGARRGAARAFALAAALAALAGAARAQDAPPDSAMQAYFRAVSDSTDAYFGLSAQPADTAGLDSALEHGLSLPPGAANRRTARLSFAPALAFNRALGAVYGGSATRAIRAGACASAGSCSGRTVPTTGTATASWGSAAFCPGATWAPRCARAPAGASSR